MDALRFDEQKIFATTKDDLRQVTRQVPVIQRVQRTVDASTSRVLTLQVESTSVTFGYSSDETEDVMPLTQSMSTRLIFGGCGQTPRRK